MLSIYSICNAERRIGNFHESQVTLESISRVKIETFWAESIFGMMVICVGWELEGFVSLLARTLKFRDEGRETNFVDLPQKHSLALKC